MTTSSRNNVIPFPKPQRAGDESNLAREIADIFDSAKPEPKGISNGDERLIARLESLASRLERIVHSANA